MTKSRIKNLLFTFLLIFSCFSSLLFAQVNSDFFTGDLDIYNSIDSAFLDKNSEQISAILASSLKDVNYPKYEEYVLQKTRSLLLSNQLDLIQSMCLAIIDNNLDNTDAVNLYMTVEKSVAKRNARNKKIEEQRKIEAEYVAKAPEQQKVDIRKDYNITDNTETGQTLFMAPVVSSYYSDFTWSIAFNIAEFGLRFTNDDNLINFGVGLMGDLYYRAPRYSIGADLFIDSSVLSFSSQDLAMREISFVPGLSFVKLNEDFFFRLGLSYMNLSNGKDFFTPVVGISLKNIKKEDFTLGFYADYYPGHFATEDMYAAMGFGGQTTLNLGSVGNVNLGLFFSLRETLFIEKSNLDSRTRITIGFGVENNE